MHTTTRLFAIQHAQQCIANARRFREFCTTHGGMRHPDEAYWLCITPAAKFRRMAGEVKA